MRIHALVVLFISLAPGAVADPAAILPLTRQTTRDQRLVERASYNYAPALLHDGSVYHLYWCGGIAGDEILHLAAPSLAGPWASASFWTKVDVALKPTGSPADFDGLHTCDPNVVKIGAIYYLYYSGEAADGALTAIGVATSADGVHFRRAGQGGPIVTAAKTDRDYVGRHLVYGAGQPAVVPVGAFVYLSFTDSTGSGANPGNGAGQFLLRSPDPLFSRDVEELGATGWQPRRPGEHRADFAYVESFGLDLAYDRLSDTVIAATDRDAGLASVLAFDPRTWTTLASGRLALAWREGPALLAEADKTIAPRRRCDSLDVVVAAAAGASSDPFSWHELGYSAGSFDLGAICGRAR